MDADDDQLKYMMHVMFYVFSGSSEKEEIFFFSFSKLQMYSIQSGLETCHSKLALESSPFIFSCFQQLNTASCIKSLKPSTELHLSEACCETAGIIALGLNSG